MKTVGFIVNPIAGMGGAVGLKGTDGKAVLEKAKALGAEPIAPTRAEEFLSMLAPLREEIRFVTGSGMMGEEEARNQDFHHTAIGKKKNETTAKDTKETVKMMSEAKVELLIFCGGDGTARDISDVIDAKLPVLGVPTGVKMQSAVFAMNPRAAARLTTMFLMRGLPLREAEVMDVDEMAFREGRLAAKLYGYMLTPYEPGLVQASKMASLSTESEMRNQAAIAIYVTEALKKDVIYIVGPGTTTRTIIDLLDEKKTLLGVDLLCNKKIIAQDVNEKQILQKIEGKAAKIIVTPIGGQGFIFGRGNQQISPTVVRRVGLENIIVIATKNKLRGLKSLRVDTGDSTLDKNLRRKIMVIADYKEEHEIEIK